MRSQAQAGHGCTAYRIHHVAAAYGHAAARTVAVPAFGPDTCASGFVWREAFEADHVCVTPATRDQTAKDNSLADGRRAGS
jgi:hypothetical protein